MATTKSDIIISKDHDSNGRKRFRIFALAAEANAEDGLIKVSRNKKAFSDDFEYRVDMDAKDLTPDQFEKVAGAMEYAQALIDGDEKSITPAAEVEKFLKELAAKQEAIAKQTLAEKEAADKERAKHMQKRLGELQKKANGKLWVVDIHHSGEGFSVINTSDGRHFGREIFATYKKAAAVCEQLLSDELVPKSESK